MTEFDGAAKQLNTSAVRQRFEKFEDDSGVILSNIVAVPDDGADIRGLLYTSQGAAGIGDRLRAWLKNAADVRAARDVPVMGNDIIIVSTVSDFTGTDVATVQPLFATTEDVITLEANSAYVIDGEFHIHSTGTTSRTLGLLFAFANAPTSMGGQYLATNAATEVLGAVSAIPFLSGAVVQVSPATATATHHSVIVKGVLRTNLATTMTPQYQWSSAPGAAGVVLANAYLRLMRMGAAATAAVGPAA